MSIEPNSQGGTGDLDQSFWGKSGRCGGQGLELGRGFHYQREKRGGSSFFSDDQGMSKCPWDTGADLVERTRSSARWITDSTKYPRE